MKNAATGPAEFFEQSPGHLGVRGPLTFATARKARDDGLRLLAAVGGTDVEFDCSGVTASDSAGLTVLLDLLGNAKRQGKTLRFTHVPPQICAVAKISEVQELL